ncbi:hypothetical protein GN958_ATG21305 [Phytophthora infestans]|uniref:Uncharacterized protein n=1 Tax=Phytophthora infestans TaxID=4787 RepID=A0A8S9TM34_PHYIN|nr:hypothetical protein GN958_ATG21305 [Phytophthora infestans]
MDAWEALAVKVRKVDGFAKTELKGKAAQAHFTSLIQAHRHWDNKFTSLSGASEDYKERKQLLDEALLLGESFSRGDYLRERADEAVKRMRTRMDGKDGGSAAKKKLKYTVYDLIHEDNELEREEKATERREKLEERRRE